MRLDDLIAGSVCPCLVAALVVMPVQAAGTAPCVVTAHACIALNADVTPSNLESTICRKGYSKSVRPLTAYTNGVKRKLLREQGLLESHAADYELDHLIPLTLGGHPRDLTNLVLQPWEGPDGAKEKDKLENRLHSRVCSGRMDLLDAQQCIADDWQRCAAAHPGKGRRATAK